MSGQAYPNTRPPASREVDQWDEFERKLGQMDEDDDDMKQYVGRDPWMIAGFVLSVLVNAVMLAIWGGRMEQRQETQEKSIQALQAKSDKDAAQDTQIAVLSTQLGQIQSTVSEIKVAVSREKK